LGLGDNRAPTTEDIREFVTDVLRIEPSEVNVDMVGPCHVEIVIPERIHVGMVRWLQGRIAEEMPSHCLFTITKPEMDEEGHDR
jgi:hypothetical protein